MYRSQRYSEHQGDCRTGHTDMGRLKGMIQEKKEESDEGHIDK